MPRRLTTGKSAWSVFTRIEEVVLSSSGADAFELVFALAAAVLFARRRGRVARADTIASLAQAASKAWPALELTPEIALPDTALAETLVLLEKASLAGHAEGLDALFEALVTRVGKGNKGQFFTPRHVVDFATTALALKAGERFVDPACGSGAFVAHASRAVRTRASGWDVDGRAVRVAKLMSIATGADPRRIERKDSLTTETLRMASSFDVIATNPPFAGAPASRGFEIVKAGGRVERDLLFLERCLDLLRAGGRLAIVLPHGKIASPAWRGARQWLLTRARVLAVVSLPKETFLPHTSQRAALVFAKKRARGGRPSPGEKIFLAVSDRAGRDHDLGRLAAPLARFFAHQDF